MAFYKIGLLVFLFIRCLCGVWSNRWLFELDYNKKCIITRERILGVSMAQNFKNNDQELWKCLIYNWNWDLQEKSSERHRKCPWVRQHAMGVGSVSSAVLDGLLLLRLERSKVHWEGTPRNFFPCCMQNFSELWNCVTGWHIRNWISAFLADDIFFYLHE